MSKSYESSPQPIVISLTRNNRKDAEERKKSSGGYLGLFMFILMASVVIAVVYLFVDDEAVEEAFRLVIPQDGPVDAETSYGIEESRDAESADGRSKDGEKSCKTVEESLY